MEYTMITAEEAKKLIVDSKMQENEDRVKIKLDKIQQKIKRAIEDGDNCILNKIDDRLPEDKSIITFLKQNNYKVTTMNIPVAYGYILISWS